MGDMREAFDQLKEINKERRGNNFQAFKDLYEGKSDPALNILTMHNEYHYTFELQDEKGQYWPSSSKWQLGKKIFHGSADQFLNWIKKRLA